MSDIYFKNVYGLESFTILDYPKHLAAILFYKNCKLRCPYCYNVDLVHGKGTSKEREVYDLLLKSKGKLDGIVFSGGECTLHGNSLYDDMKFAKSLGYDIKLDTNGINHDVVVRLIEDNIVNYVALDYKCPSEDKHLFALSEEHYTNFTKTLDYLIDNKIDFEVRTTVHPDITPEEKINEIIYDLEDRSYTGTYYLQYYFDAPKTLGNVDHSPRPIRKDKIDNPKNFNIVYRNA